MTPREAYTNFYRDVRTLRAERIPWHSITRIIITPPDAAYHYLNAAAWSLYWRESQPLDCYHPHLQPIPASPRRYPKPGYSAAKLFFNR